MHTALWAIDIKNNPGRNMKYTYVINQLSRLLVVTLLKLDDLCGEDEKDRSCSPLQGNVLVSDPAITH